MQKAVAKEGPRAPLFYLGVVIMLAASGPAAAQAVEQSDLERCSSLATSELKLACFEALTAIKGREAEPAAETTPQPQPETAAAEKALTGAAAAAGVAGSDAGLVAPAPAAAASEDQPDVAGELGLEHPDEEQVELADELNQALTDEEQVDIADALASEYPDEEQPDLVNEIGREHLDEKTVDKEEETVVRATVSKVVKGGFDVLYFHFTNGQVWRQVESRRFSYPRDGEFEVVIDTGMMGDYRLRLDRGGPMTPIRRVK
jgi:hypothetical protein